MPKGDRDGITQPGWDGIPEQWYRESFGVLYPVLYAHRTVEAAGPEAAFAVSETGVEEPTRVLDLCCGNGRHLVHLAEYTPHAVGLDYSAELLEMAQENARGRVPLVRADMRAIPFRDTFDVITSFFTSFGYFASEADDLSVVKGMVAALRQGGRFLIDHMNAERAVSELEPHTERQAGGYLVEETRWVDHKRGRVNKRICVLSRGEIVAQFSESVRLYTPRAMRHLLEEGGLVIDRVFGDYMHAPYESDSPRMIIVGHKG